MDIRKQIKDIVEADIQIALNDYIEKEGSQGVKGQKLNAKMNSDEVNKIIKEYKRLKKEEKSNLGAVKKMGLVDKNGRALCLLHCVDEHVIAGLIWLGQRRATAGPDVSVTGQSQVIRRHQLSLSD